MDFSYNENQKMISEMIQQFGKNNITPYVRKWDDNQYFPIDVFKKLGELGLMGVLVPTKFGGSGFSYNEYITSIEQLAILDPSIALSILLITLYVQDIFCSLEMTIKRKNGYQNWLQVNILAHGV